MNAPIVGFAGLTHLGLVSASTVCGRGFDVVCFEPQRDLVDRLRRREWPVLEPGLPELIASNGGRQRFTSERTDLAACDIIYVSPDVPTDDHGRSDITSLSKLIGDVAAVMNPTAIMVILSQVPPGYTRALDVLPPERLYYQVETLVFGIAVERASKPERYIIGCADPLSPIEPRFAAVLGAFGCPILPMRYESAELAKISINCCLVASVSVANTLAELCEKIGADWSEIVPALKLDRRIGAYSYLNPGLGLSGGNLERDLITMQRLAQAFGTEAGVVTAWLQNSSHRKNWPLRQVYEHVLSRLDQPTIGILGVTYKENTNSIKNSPAVALIRALQSCALRVFDPVVRASPDWHPNMIVADDPLDVCDGADALVIATPWPAFRSLKLDDLTRKMRGRVVIDPFCLMKRDAARTAGFNHIALGAPQQANAK